MHELNLTGSFFGILSVLIFLGAYVLVIFEESTHMRKSKPVMLAAGLIWTLIGIAYAMNDMSDVAHEHATFIVEEYGELFLFLLVAITYVNTMEERRVFDALRAKLVGIGLSYRKLFWLTGILAFFLSGVLDNLTTALVMGAVVVAVGRTSMKFVTAGCVNIVVAANAGGAFTPFGDITTLMVWQKGVIEFFEFFVLLLPSLVNWGLPALIMSFAVPHDVPPPTTDNARMKPGGAVVVWLFAATIITAISFKNFLHLPPAMGMMMGLGYMQIFTYFLTRKGKRLQREELVLDSFKQFERVEWDTLLFFFGIIFAVGGLGVLGYLDMLSTTLYEGLGPTPANMILGALSAVVDNIPLMFAVLTMDPQMSHGDWLTITLTCGVGGSLLSIGSAAGVALMGQARGLYTFSGHLKWTWAIALGYFASIGVHLLINSHHFEVMARVH
ncbi:sodium:proton antiporter NhaD [Rhodobacter lacus]|uniref:Sodium:proton antiporter NhaD n=1 Tax=Rhodobacter lacus TaxID=1641972 RepID=A0ABW5A3V0_9RHOB